jgi:hypothetical protein
MGGGTARGCCTRVKQTENRDAARNVFRVVTHASSAGVKCEHATRKSFISSFSAQCNATHCSAVQCGCTAYCGEPAGACVCGANQGTDFERWHGCRTISEGTVRLATATMEYSPNCFWLESVILHTGRMAWVPRHKRHAQCSAWKGDVWLCRCIKRAIACTESAVVTQCCTPLGSAPQSNCDVGCIVIWLQEFMCVASLVRLAARYNINTSVTNASATTLASST